MRARRVLSLVFIASSLVACAAILGVGDLTVDGGAGDASDAGDSGPECGVAGKLDECVGEGGVLVMLSGELNNLSFAGSPSTVLTLYATGWVEAGAASTELYVQSFPAPGEAGAHVQDNSGTYGTSTSFAQQNPPPLYIVGFGPRGAQVYSYLTDLVDTQFSAMYLSDASIPNAVILDVRGAVRNGSWLYFGGTVATADGGQRGYMARLASGSGPASVGSQTAITLINAVSVLPAGPIVMFVGNSQTGGQPVAYFYDGLLTSQQAQQLTIPFGPGSRVWNSGTSNGSFWVVGELADASGMAVTHVVDASIDPTFADGAATLPGNDTRGRAVVALGNWVYLAGSDQGQPAIARFALDGGLDPSFADGGVLTLPYTGELRSLVIDNARHVVAGGVVSTSAGSRWLIAWVSY